MVKYVIDRMIGVAGNPGVELNVSTRGKTPVCVVLKVAEVFVALRAIMFTVPTPFNPLIMCNCDMVYPTGKKFSVMLLLGLLLDAPSKFNVPPSFKKPINP